MQFASRGDGTTQKEQRQRSAVRAINEEGAINWCRWVLTRELTRLIILTGGHTACGFIDANVDITLVIVRRYAVVSVRS